MTIRKFIFHGGERSETHASGPAEESLVLHLIETPHRWCRLSLLACVVVLAAQVSPGIAVAQLAPVQNENSPTRIPSQYIVVFKPGTPRNVVTAAQERVRGLGGTVEHTYASALIGFSVKLPDGAVQALRAVPGIDYIEADQKVTIQTVQNNPPTGLDRTSERLLGTGTNPPLDNRYTYSENGAGVHVYVIDTGIRITHNEFGSRAFGAGPNGFDAFGGTGDDCLGHGTHVAGTIGGATYGVAKQVSLHSVRVIDCSGSGTTATLIAGVNWVTDPLHRILPAVANMSLGGSPSTALANSVTASVASGVTYVVSAGNSSANACNFSPGDVPAAITVASINPTNDSTSSTSNWGPCVDLFAPGVLILSASNTNDTATSIRSGTSMAAPHVAGAAALHLQFHQFDSPVQVWDRIFFAANRFGTIMGLPATAGWPGIINVGTSTPNVLLHWGSLNDGFNDGDPHLTTVGGIHYDFQSAGEFVALRDGNGTQIQTRQTPVSTQPPIANTYTGLATCVSLNTAVAARVGTHRVTYQPNLDGRPDPGGLQLRVDGVLKSLGAQGLNLGPGGRVVKSSAGNGIEIDFPDGTSLTATSNFWGPPHNKWYLSVSVFRTPASEGIMGAFASGSWLPALPDGTSLGPMPAALPQRYSDLYGKFADAWRVTNTTSLFDYAPGTSTATFTLASWPPEKPPCVAPESPAAKPVDQAVAQRLCREVTDKNRNANCVFDVGITGEPGFAKLYLVSQQIQAGATRTMVNDNKDRTLLGEQVTFIATVALRASGKKGVPTGSVQFTLDGAQAGEPVKLDRSGRATWKTSRLQVGNHKVTAVYIPATGGVFLTSSSLDNPHAVVKEASTQK
jgi:subtilisin family serine protease